MNKVIIEPFNFSDSNYCIGDYKYRVVDIVEIAKDLPVFELPLQGIDLSVYPWGEKNHINDLIYHMDRMSKADLQYPIILDPNGYICDGWHRVCKAILEGKTTIKAKRLTVLPDALA